MKQSFILIAHPDRSMAGLASKVLEEAGFHISLVADGRRAIGKLRQVKAKVILMDCVQALPCADIIRRMGTEAGGPAVLIFAGSASAEATEQALRAGAYDVVPVPVRPEMLLAAVRRAVERQDLREQLTAVRRALVEAEGLVMGKTETGVSLQGVERELLLRALKKFGGNQTHAARYLQITRRTLIYRMGKYGLRELF